MRKSSYLPSEIIRYTKVWWKLRQHKRYSEAINTLLNHKYPAFRTVVILLGWHWIGWGLVTCTQEISPPVVESKYAYGGLPASLSYPNALTQLERIGYIVGYDSVRKNPAWVAYKVPAGKAEKAPKRPRRFNTDLETQSKVRHKDYTRSGYDRGHMAPNYAIATRYGVKAQKETFLMSNIVPQKPALNRGPWRALEMDVANRNGLANRKDGVWIITGPIYDTNVEYLKSGIEIPDSFFKMVIDNDNGKPKVLAFVMPQEVKHKSKLVDYLVSVNKIEELTGLDFMAEVDDSIESQIESETARKIW